MFFINKHIFFTTFSTKIFFTTITHLSFCNKHLIWGALHATSKMYLLCGFRIIVIRGDHEFKSVSNLAANLPTTPFLDWAAAVQHCGLIKRNIQFVKEKVRSVRHSLPFERVPAIIVIQMVLPTEKFINVFPQQGVMWRHMQGVVTRG